MINIGDFSTNIFSLVLVVVVFFVLVKFKTGKKQLISLVTIGLLLDVNQLQGYFVRFGTKEVSYEDAYMFFLLLYCIFMITQLRIKQKYFKLAFLLICVATMGIVLEIVFPYSNLIINSDTTGAWDAYIAGMINKEPLHINFFRVALIYFRLVLYSLLVVICKSNFDEDDYCLIFRKIVFWLKIPVIYGFIEYLTKNILDLGITNDINNVILGLGTSTFGFGEIRDGRYILQGLTREPSHYAYVLFFSILVFIISGKLNESRKKKNLIMILMAIFVMLMSGAFSGLVYICVIMSFIYIISGDRIKKSSTILKMMMLCIGGIVLLYFTTIISQFDSMSSIVTRLRYFYSNIGMIFSGEWHGRVGAFSEIIRFVSIVDTMKDVFHRPLFGLGCGIEWAHSGFVTMLASIGFLGTALWCKLAVAGNRRWAKFTFILVLIFLPNLLVGFVDMIFSPVSLLLVESASVLNVDIKRIGEKDI